MVTSLPVNTNLDLLFISLTLILSVSRYCIKPFLRLLIFNLYAYCLWIAKSIVERIDVIFGVLFKVGDIESELTIPLIVQLLQVQISFKP